MAEPSDDGSSSEVETAGDGVSDSDSDGTAERAAETSPPAIGDASDGRPQPEDASGDGDRPSESEGGPTSDVDERIAGNAGSETNGSRSERSPQDELAQGGDSDPVPPEEEEYLRRAVEREQGSTGDGESVSSLAGRAKPAIAERQALVAVAGSVGVGVGMAVVGVLLDMTIRDVKVVLSLGGLLVLFMGVFVLFRAMLSAAERNDDSVKTALTHPLFMFLFVVLATGTALFIGLLRLAY
jgi:hypothetical protein